MKKILLILCALLLTAVGASAQTIAHECVADINDWTITGNTNGEFHYDDWAAEADESGMVVPFLEYWVWIGDNRDATLSAATISHTTLENLDPGYYEVSLDIRIFSEAGNDIGEGATFTANTVSEDIVSGTDSHSGVYGTETEVYGTYRLLVYVTEGTLDISLTIPEGATYNWIAFKNLEVTYLGDSPVGYVAHDCEALLSHWSITGNTNGEFHLNTWSTETDPSGMTTPLLEYWVGSWEGTLSAATINHEQLADLPEGYYEISIDIRIFSEAGNEITVGGTLTANSASENLLSGSDIHSGTYGTETLVYGTCHLLAQVTEAGTLDISIVIPSGVAYNWISFKNLKVVYDGATMPTLEYVTGDMNSAVETAMKTAVDTYNNNKTSENYTAALAAIDDAEASVAQYAEVAALVAALDTAGKTVWETTTSASMYNAKSLTTSDDITVDMVAAQLAQTTTGSDLSYTLQNTGTWVNAINATNFQMCPSLPTAHEVWSENAWTLPSGTTSADAIYKQIEDLPAGEYTISFYAYGNAAENASRPLAFANAAETTVAYTSALAWNESSLYTLTCTVGEDGILQFGMKTQGAGNWYVMEENSLTLIALAGEVVIDWDMTDAGWGTMILPFAADVPSGLTMYAGSALTLDEDESTITVGEAATSIAANVPYLVSGAEGTYSFNGTPVEAESLTDGMLTGTLVDMTQDDFAADGTEYVLQNHDDEEGLAFYPIIDGQSEGVTLSAYHCYLTSEVTPMALHLPGTATAIKAVESDVIASDAIYDLSGRRVAKAVKGVYIQNGKKVLVK